MTAHALDGEKEKCIREGMNDYLAKPFKEEELLQKIAAWPPNGKTEPLAKNNLIDLSFLKQQTRDNDSFIAEMAGLFKKEIPANIATNSTTIILQANFLFIVVSFLLQ